MTVTAVYLQSVQHIECLQKAASKLSGMNMHSGLKIDAIGMAFVAGHWVSIKNVVCRSRSAMVSQGPSRTENSMSVKMRCQLIAMMSVRVFLTSRFKSERG